MANRASRSVLTCLVLLAASACSATEPSAATAGYEPSTAKGDWPLYTADLHGTKYSPLDQIDASNFEDLEVAWSFKTDNLGNRPEYKLEGTPLAVNGILYTTAGTRRAAIALDGATGELIWMYSMREGKRGGYAPRQLSGRGLSYWTDGRGDERVLYVTPGYRLVCLDAKTGEPIDAFGDHGVVDLKVGVIKGDGEQIDLETGEVGLHSTPTVAGDVILVGSAMAEGFTVPTSNNSKGVVRAFDVRTGKMVWRFNTIPGPGEFGNDTWEDGSWARNGNTGVWTQMTVDEDAGIAYLPVESPTSDFYGGARPGDNLFGESLVAVDLKTGERKWHFQFVHHPDLGSRHVFRAAHRRRRHRRARAQGGRRAEQAELPLRLRSDHGRADLADRGDADADERGARREDVADAAHPLEAAGLRAQLPQGPGRRHRLHAGHALRGARDPEALQDRARSTTRPWPGAWTACSASILVGNASGGTNWPGGGMDPETGIVYAQAANSFVSGASVTEPPRASPTWTTCTG